MTTPSAPQAGQLTQHGLRSQEVTVPPPHCPQPLAVPSQTLALMVTSPPPPRTASLVLSALSGSSVPIRRCRGCGAQYMPTESYHRIWAQGLPAQ